MSDLISRQKSLDRLKYEMKYGAEIDRCGLDTAYDIIENIPSTEPERTAKVYQKQAPDRLYYFYCGACGEMIDCSFREDYESIKSYCGYCGAKLDWSNDE